MLWNVGWTRFFFLVLAVMIVLNGDKIVAFLNVLLKLLGP